MRLHVLETMRSLAGDRVVLRPLDKGDLRRCVKWLSDREVTYFLGRSSSITLGEEERWFREYERKSDEQIFAIELEGRHIGNAGLHRIDRTHRKADLGIMIGEASLWSHGYGSDALRTLLGYAFAELGLHKVSLDVLEYNHRGIRTYEKAGFVREGLHRQDIFKDGRFFDVVRMGILAEEFARGSSESPASALEVPGLESKET